MSSEIRSAIRIFEKWFADKETRKRALNDIHEAISKADINGDFAASQAYLLKLADFYNELGEWDKVEPLKAHATLRATLQGDTKVADQIIGKLNLDHPYSSIMNTIEEARRGGEGSKYYLLDLEVQNIFGEYKEISPLPLIDFGDEEELQITLEDYFQIGLYHAVIIERKTLARKLVEIPVGKKEQLDAVESLNKQIIQ